jgi:hypothetical protein
MYVTKAHRIMQRAGPSGPFDMKQGSHLLALLIHAYILINYDFRWQREWLLTLHCGYDMSTHTWFLHSKCNNSSALDSGIHLACSHTYLSSHTHPRRGDFVIYRFNHIRRLDVNVGGVFFIHVKSYMLHWNFCCVFEYLNVMCVWCRNGKLIWAVVEMEKENFKKLKKDFYIINSL